MDIKSARAFCLSLPHAMEGVQWGNDLLFRIGGKIFAVMALDAATLHRISCRKRMSCLS
jgi:predicted DNA-binding protein (MmcQ/YjbR family)